MKIQGPKPGVLQGGQRVQDRQESLDSKSGATQRSGDRVNLSMQAELAALKTLAMEASVDEISLEQLEQAIREGTYQPDLQGLQERLLAQPMLFKELLDT